MAKAMRWKFDFGRREKPKSKDQIEDEERRERERRQQRELNKVVVLKDITLKVPKGKFVCIIGKTGSGKSSLLSALCGEMITIPHKLIDSYKGDGDMDKVLEPEEAHALMDDLIHNASTKIDYEVNGSIAYTAQ